MDLISFAKQRNGTLSEFAVAVPVLVILVFSATQAARMYIAQQAVSQAASLGARAAAVLGDTPTVRNWIDVQLAAAGLTSSQITISAPMWCWGHTVEVTVKAPFTLSLPLVGDISFELSATEQGTVERDLDNLCPSY
nr:pilus assembly protein [Anaerolineae bacterium]